MLVALDLGPDLSAVAVFCAVADGCNSPFGLRRWTYIAASAAFRISDTEGDDALRSMLRKNCVAAYIGAFLVFSLVQDRLSRHC